MIVQTRSVTGKTQEKQTESRDDISDNELADPTYIPQEPSDYKKSQNASQRPAY